MHRSHVSLKIDSRASSKQFRIQTSEEKEKYIN